MQSSKAREQYPPGVKLRREFAVRGGVSCVAWSPDGRWLATAGAESVSLWNPSTGRRRWEIRKSTSDPYDEAAALAWTPDGRRLLYTSDEKVMSVEADDPSAPHALEGGHAAAATDLAVTPDGRHAVSTSLDKTARVWNLATGQELVTFQGHGAHVWAVVVTPDGECAVTAGGTWHEDQSDCTIKVWGLRDGREMLTLRGHTEPIYALALGRDGQQLISAGADDTIRLWDMLTGQSLKVVEGHRDFISGISLSADGRLLASKSKDGSVRLWRCGDTWETAASLEETHSGYNHLNLAFHPERPLLASVDAESGSVRIWKVDARALLHADPDDGGPVHYTTARIALVGDSGVGKTGLGWRLAHGEFREQSSTHGQQFWVIDELGTTRHDGTECEAVLWDFAGQPDYRLIHSLFLDDIDLALVLFDPTGRDEPLKGVEYWLRQLRSKGEPRRAILVGARADRGTPTLSYGEVEEFCRRHGVENGYVHTSALTGGGLEELLERIKASIDWDTMTTTVTTTTFKRIKEFVLSLKSDPGRCGVLVSPPELRQRLERSDPGWEFSDAEMMTAVGHLSTHGYVTVLRGSKGEETILLTPDLLADVASSLVLEARRNPKGLGALDEGLALGGGYPFPEFAKLDERERGVLLDAAVALFLEHNLCFRETLGTRTLLVFPALINQRPPQRDEAETVEDASYRVTGAVEQVYPALVVLLGYTNTFARTNQWQNQAEYETASGDVCGFRLNEERDGEIELVLYYLRERPGARQLFQGLVEHFLRGHDVTVNRFVPVTCALGHLQPRAVVMERIAAGKDFGFCPECGNRVPLPKAGEPIALSSSEQARLNDEKERAQHRTAFESALVRVKAVVRDEHKSAPRCFVSHAAGDDAHERWVRHFANDLQNAGVKVVHDGGEESSPAPLLERAESCNFICVVATPLYGRRWKGRTGAEWLESEALRKSGSVLPLLLEGTPQDSVPEPLRKFKHLDFRQGEMYFATLFDLILTLYRIPFDHPAVSDLREVMRRGAAKSSS